MALIRSITAMLSGLPKTGGRCQGDDFRASGALRHSRPPSSLAQPTACAGMADIVTHTHLPNAGEDRRAPGRYRVGGESSPRKYGRAHRRPAHVCAAGSSSTELGPRSPASVAATLIRQNGRSTSNSCCRNLSARSRTMPPCHGARHRSSWRGYARSTTAVRPPALEFLIL